MQQTIAILLSLFVAFFGGVTSLRNVRLLVEPSVVIRGGTATITCSRDMEGAPLYSVKWYRGNHEFYRYTPNEDPPTKQFATTGINVDMRRSNGSAVVLRKMDLALAGNFSCEVTADSKYYNSTFTTKITTKFIDVIVVPLHGPTLMADKDRYRAGETLSTNCSASPSRPAANLTIYINDEPHRSTETILHQSESGLQWASVATELTVTPDLFPGGRLRVACEASIFDIYSSTAKLDFFTPEADPRPERITLSKATQHFQGWTLVILVILPATVYKAGSNY